ncbi:hypothetical protein [Flavobacterium sp.]|jgi:hypothetical protein|uniref:hypothetical protein n=1 Tax=Flavobacterium sp. TaxID=239 RepID=UPI0037C09FAE
MTTITLKINERSKAGKAFMTMTNFFIESKSVKIIENSSTKNTVYQEFEEALKEVKQIEEGKIKPKSLKDFLDEQ